MRNMPISSLEQRVSDLESRVTDLQNQIASAAPRAGKDWRRTIGMFTDDEGMQAIFAEALKIREADRKKSRISRATKGKGKP